MSSIEKVMFLQMTNDQFRKERFLIWIFFYPIIRIINFLPLNGVASWPSPMQRPQPRAQNMRPPEQQADMFFISKWTSFLREHIPDSSSAIPVWRWIVDVSRLKNKVFSECGPAWWGWGESRPASRPHHHSGQCNLEQFCCWRDNLQGWEQSDA